MRASLASKSLWDISLLLGLRFDGADPEARRIAAVAALERFPQLATIACTSRTVVSSLHHRISARIDGRDGAFETAPLDVTDVVYWIGTGDAFAAGVLAKFRDGPEAAAGTGLALAALKHSIPGDQSTTSADELEESTGYAGDVRR